MLHKPSVRYTPFILFGWSSLYNSQRLPIRYGNFLWTQAALKIYCLLKQYTVAWTGQKVPRPFAALTESQTWPRYETSFIYTYRCTILCLNIKIVSVVSEKYRYFLFYYMTKWAWLVKISAVYILKYIRYKNRRYMLYLVFFLLTKK